MDNSFLLFSLVGFLAQLVDGALGMAYGVVASSVLLSFGVAPAVASASTHFAEIFTTGASASSHVWHRNVSWRMLATLAPAGVLGGVIGTYVLTTFDGNVMRPFIALYLGVVGVWIVARALMGPATLRKPKAGALLPLGGAGGFIDAVGGGGWGPSVTTALIGAGGAPRETIGTVNTAEFFLTMAVSVSFMVAIFTGHWDEGGVAGHIAAVAGLIVGGVLAAPLAGYVVKIMPARTLMLLVGVLILLLAVYQTWRLV
ncbi:sulfite exporter TauE/SafE family protein [Pseudoroseicyclus tamaricis]|uniref:Probable membrane transporter protein n=1 Tax=Pseudoroseicyclus tamaricis TaxID=2705421 RepID=A0A6B2JUX5_9RHOB|nr:sulfite exporter TauE/SafE family protein [Pseudoroseicyclus tamaricis]NDV02138.1 sulfite exporter TauE/SafE family protein [Pseudoroseicyclus tamaricis]